MPMYSKRAEAARRGWTRHDRDEKVGRFARWSNANGGALAWECERGWQTEEEDGTIVNHVDERDALNHALGYHNGPTPVIDRAMELNLEFVKAHGPWFKPVVALAPASWVRFMEELHRSGDYLALTSWWNSRTNEITHRVEFRGIAFVQGDTTTDTFIVTDRDGSFFYVRPFAC